MVSEEEMAAWNMWFSRKLESELKYEKARLRRRLLRKKSKRRSVLAMHPTRSFGLTQPGTEMAACMIESDIDRAYRVTSDNGDAGVHTTLNLRTDDGCPLKSEGAVTAETKGKAHVDNDMEIETLDQVKVEEYPGSKLANAALATHH